MISGFYNIELLLLVSRNLTSVLSELDFHESEDQRLFCLFDAAKLTLLSLDIICMIKDGVQYVRRRQHDETSNAIIDQAEYDGRRASTLSIVMDLLLRKL